MLAVWIGLALDERERGEVLVWGKRVGVNNVICERKGEGGSAAVMVVVGRTVLVVFLAGRMSLAVS